MASNSLDILNLLASGLGTSDSISVMSGKTSASDDQVTAALLSALPSMLGQMKTNASTQSGASSLLGALDQHDLGKLSNEDIVSLIKNADEEDGAKILDKIYGSKEKTEQATASLAKKSGVSASQMAKIMAIAAPALLTAVASAKKKQAAQAAAEAAAAASKKSSESDDLMALLQSLSGVNTGSLTSGKKTTGGKKTSSAKKSDDGLDLGDILSMAGALTGSSKTSSKKDDGLDLGDILSMAGALSGSTSGKKTQSSGVDIGSLMNMAGALTGSSSGSSGSSDGLSSLLGTLLKGKKLF